MMDEDVNLVDMPVMNDDNDGLDDEPRQALPVVPPPRSSDDIFDLDEEDPNAPALAEIQDVPMASTKKSRKGVKMNLASMDVNRLLGKKGLPAVEGYFKNVKFKEEGHELENLNLLLSTLEHWSHNMCPKLMFEDCLEKIEKLGQKREVKTYMKKYRMGDDDDGDDKRGEEGTIESDNNASDDEEQERNKNQPSFLDIYGGPSARSNEDKTEQSDNANQEEASTSVAQETGESSNMASAEVLTPSVLNDIFVEDSDGRDGNVPSGFIPFQT